jgi:hypothetical protein
MDKPHVKRGSAEESGMPAEPDSNNIKAPAGIIRSRNEKGRPGGSLCDREGGGEKRQRQAADDIPEQSGWVDGNTWAGADSGSQGQKEMEDHGGQRLLKTRHMRKRRFFGVREAMIFCKTTKKIPN